MNIHLTLSAPLPWLTAIAKILSRKKQTGKGKTSLFVFPRTLSFTKEGRRFIAILFVIGIAAINTGNNLLYLVVAMMLSLIVISGILSESTLRNIEICRTMPLHIFADTPALVRWTILNMKSLVPSFSITIEELPNKKLTAEAGYILKLPSQTHLTQTKSYVFRKRGWHQIDGFKINTRFPFGFFLKGRRLYAPLNILVYPKLKHFIDTAESSHGKMGDTITKAKGQGAQLYNIRDYTLDDDSRLIHWKSSAKTLRLMAKEFEKEKKKLVKIIFYNTLLELPGYEEKFEDMVEKAAGLADYFINSGFKVSFKSLSAELPPKSGREQLYRILRELALIEPVVADKNIPLDIKVLKQ
ncbi:MAG: hypothetical protein A2022_05140 [Deltaproteobacteria bacterium GWF2_42_12]|nr:MAG: hypothetical protein A2090_01550 [Deltaproteobacteria bacterium GWD2_42_10]OGP47758.1 MAG: hypothetical protein A2022_05140 [Deltaproteobacteria bacterium GWF2_42_12]OGQ67807.1 MAG: hypothetical protein A3F88_09270 [Deltaproteobacteria bacterium RIFCSPLOWO2_12_FULL_42_16]OGQ74843.1 MAG: hypothetical protein A2235_09620 [Deltaproteobacteria bacterium RIFOXYA2_FULL_42_10]